MREKVATVLNGYQMEWSTPGQSDKKKQSFSVVNSTNQR